MKISFKSNLQPPIEESFILEALSELNIEQLTVIRSLLGGKTKASVLIVDIIQVISEPTNLAIPLSGWFVLKVDEIPDEQWNEDMESERLKKIKEIANSPEFFDQFVPSCHFDKQVSGRIVMIYDIAGHSTSGLMNYGDLVGDLPSKYCGSISDQLLNNLNHQYQVIPGFTGRRLLEEWLGYRLRKDQGTRLWDFAGAWVGGGQAFVKAGRIFIDPLAVCEEQILVEDNGWNKFGGINHGDLHAGNILFDRLDPQSSRFWIIDWALSGQGPLFYDQAYLELSLTIGALEGKPLEQLAVLLEELDSSDGNDKVLKVPQDLVSVSSSIKAIRDRLNTWQVAKEEHRHDPFVYQLLLARLAVGLNWVNKRIDDDARQIAYLYAAKAATEFMKRFYPERSSELLATLESPPLVQTSSDVDSTNQVWSEFWQRVSGFSEREFTYLLVADHIDSDEGPAIGFLPWSAIIDLDQESEDTGLYSRCASILQDRRSLIQFGRDARDVNFDRGTAWLMANGWPSRNEDTPQTMSEWRTIYLKRIQDLVSRLRKASAPRKLKVVLIPTNDARQQIFIRVLERIDEEFGENVDFIIIGDAQNDLSTHDRIGTRVNLSPRTFMELLRRTYGMEQPGTVAQMIGNKGIINIDPNRLRNWEEDLEVLHSRILSDTLDDATDSNDFVRGLPPTWHDLNANVDVPREISTKLLSAINEKFDVGSSFILELKHSPGAGATTAAYRLAWDLRHLRPVVILRRFGRLTADRIDTIYQLCQLPILIVADASDLSGSSREELFRELTKRNARFGILYLIRAGYISNNSEFELIDPITDENELARFAEAYLIHCDNEGKKQRIRQIANISLPSYQFHRSPFFFGLTTFENDFHQINTYVRSHLVTISEINRNVILYCALTTRFSQKGISESFFKKLAYGNRTSGQLNLVEVLGYEASRLLVSAQGRVRFVHPLLAEQALKELLRGSPSQWKDNLIPICLQLINDVTTTIGYDADETHELFTQLFINRDMRVDGESWFRLPFSALISAIPSVEGQQLILERLTEVCPDEPHYWNHLGRHLISQTNGDFRKAEQCLLKAVDLSNEKDALHLHTLGMVRRNWANSILDSEVSNFHGVMGAEKLLDLVIDTVDGALSAFSEARELDAEDAHNYITPVQTILSVAERMVQVSGQTLAQLVIDTGMVPEWLRKYITEAEYLLSRVRHFRARFDADQHEQRCEVRLMKLYGDLDILISLWENTVDGPTSNAWLRSAIAGVYIARADRKMKKLPVDELKKIVDLMERNLDSDPTNEHDLRTWFHAYKELPSFSYILAISRLQVWARRTNTLDAYYYLYIVHFLNWRAGNASDQSLVIENLAKSKQYAVGHRDHSYEWLSVDSSPCPLIAARDLGGWNHQKNFFKDTSKLAYVEGTILSNHRTGGLIKIGRELQAFFIPPANIRESEHIGARVRFVLGFSYERLRAWLVELV